MPKWPHDEKKERSRAASGARRMAAIAAALSVFMDLIRSSKIIELLGSRIELEEFIYL